MKLVQIKTARELKLPGIHVEFVTEGDTLKEVILRPEGEPESYAIRHPGSYSNAINVFVRREFEIKERFRLSGTLFDIKVIQDFDDKGEAERKRDSMLNRDASADLKVELVQVRVDEAGEPVAHLNDDIPF